MNSNDKISHFTTLWIWILHFTQQFCNYGLLTYFYYELRVLHLNSDLSMICVHSYIFFVLITQCAFKFLPYRRYYLFRAILGVQLFGIISTVILILQCSLFIQRFKIHCFIWPAFMHAIASGGSIELVRVIVKFSYHKEQENRKVSFLFRMTEYLGQLYAVIQISWFDDKQKTEDFGYLSLNFLLISKIIGLLTLFLVMHKINDIQHENNVLLTLMSFYFSNLKNWILHISENKNVKSKKEFKIKDSSSMVSQTLYALPLFFPLILVLYYFDIKFSKYLRQSEQLINEFFIEGERVHHNAILTVFPATKLISLPMLLFVVIPLYEKYSRNVLTTFKQYLWSCFFLLLSIVSACITESHFETDPLFHQHNGIMYIFNGILEPVLIHVSAHDQYRFFIQPINVGKLINNYPLPPTF